MNELLERMFDFRPRIAVCGDAMLDEYYEVEADKISPEFPIPVLRSPTGSPHSVVLGGAANVCAQLRNFNAHTSLFALANEGVKGLAGEIDMDGCVFSHPVPVKKRYYSGGFPLCRIDAEGTNYGYSDEVLRPLQGKVLDNLFSSGPYDVVVFSDYDKGVFHGLSDFVPRAGDAITIVDPKRGPADRWRGCTIIKPNAKEAREITGESDWRRQCSELMRRTGCQAVVVTQGGEGVVGNVQGVWFEYRPNRPSVVRSVVGAGDCFVAVLAMCMCHSIDIRRGVALAFESCASYVEQQYNKPLHPYQLSPSKFVDPRVLASRDFSLAFSNGCFDILHPGHIELLKYAKSKADRLVVALNSDESARRLNKNHPLVNDLAHRKSMIAALECVDFVLDFSEDTPLEIIKAVSPDVLVKGGDWPDPIGSDLVNQVFSFERVGGHSTSGMFAKIRSVEST